MRFVYCSAGPPSRLPHCYITGSRISTKHGKFYVPQDPGDGKGEPSGFVGRLYNVFHVKSKLAAADQPVTELSARDRNNEILWRVERSRYVKLTTSPPIVSRLPRQCGTLNI
jgi:hypothetical protein